MAIRDIIFRGKRIDNDEWVYGGYHKHDTVKICIAGDEPKTKHLIVADGFCDWGFEPPLMGYNVDPETIGQYTGLTDKNGKKIFEGDIVKIDGYEKGYEVKYMLGQFFVGIHMPIAYKRFECEVIGNIHDNPELLEVDND